MYHTKLKNYCKYSLVLFFGDFISYDFNVVFSTQIPHAATCFNTLKLPDYSNEQQFRNKMLIAIRFGSEGFEFS